MGAAGQKSGPLRIFIVGVLPHGPRARSHPRARSPLLFFLCFLLSALFFLRICPLVLVRGRRTAAAAAWILHLCLPIPHSQVQTAQDERVSRQPVGTQVSQGLERERTSPLGVPGEHQRGARPAPAVSCRGREEHGGVGLQREYLQRVGRLPAVHTRPSVLPVVGPASRPPRPHFQTTVSLAVALQVVLPGEGLVAEGALEGPRATVEGEVVLQVVRVEEAGRTVGAGVGPLARVLPHVDLQLVVPEGDKRRGIKAGRRQRSGKPPTVPRLGLTG